MIIDTRDGHVVEVLADWLRRETRLIGQLEAEGWCGSKTKCATVNSMTRMARLLTTIATFSLGRDPKLCLDFLLQLLLAALNKKLLSTCN